MPTSTGRRQRRKDRPCPECGKLLSGQGFVGHLRFEHGLDHEDAKAHAQRVRPVDVVDDDQADDDPSAEEPGTEGESRANDWVGPAMATGIAGLAILAAIFVNGARASVVRCAACGEDMNVQQARAEGSTAVMCPHCMQVNAIR